MDKSWIWIRFILIPLLAYLGSAQFSRPADEFISDVFVDTPQQHHEQFNQNPQIAPSQQQRLTMSESCLACLCAASTGCQLTTRCLGQGQYCGPFLISKPYWTDSGSPVILGDSPESDEAFTNCAMDPVCSAQSVRKYMTRYQKDCNRNGEIDCEDLSMIHLMGPAQCTNSIAVHSTDFYSKFRRCWDSVLRLSFPSHSQQQQFQQQQLFDNP